MRNNRFLIFCLATAMAVGTSIAGTATNTNANLTNPGNLATPAITATLVTPTTSAEMLAPDIVVAVAPNEAVPAPNNQTSMSNSITAAPPGVNNQDANANTRAIDQPDAQANNTATFNPSPHDLMTPSPQTPSQITI